MQGLINVCAENGAVDRAEHWLQQILQRRLEPNQVSYSSSQTATSEQIQDPSFV